eukprot:SAG22_NODE_292_length_12914_cov_41.306594_9_plen_70_part_00
MAPPSAAQARLAAAAGILLLLLCCCPAALSTREELATLKLSELTDAALDADSPRAAFVELLVRGGRPWA